MGRARVIARARGAGAVALTALALVPVLAGCGGGHRPPASKVEHTGPASPARAAAAPPLSALRTTVSAENARPGDASWLIFKASRGRVEAYSSQVSVAPGGELQLHVSLRPAGRYEVRVFRLGWYGGLGGRLESCLPSCTGAERGHPQRTRAADPRTGELDAGWPVTDTVAVGHTWLSGYYVADVVLMPRRGAGIGYQVPFVVRGPAGNHSDIVVQASVNTWQAYNNWGGKSLYAFNSSGRVAATKVSFDRPYNAQIANATPFSFEYNLVRFLERRGYDVTYTTDVDTDADPAQLLRHRLVVVDGHDEYWTHTMRAAFDRAIAAGVNVAFFGADIGAWQARYENHSRTLVEYRSAARDPERDPARKTVGFRSLGHPECQIMAVQHSDAAEGTGSGPRRNFTVTAALVRSPWAAGSGLAAGDPIRSVIGYEWDSPMLGCVSPPPKTGPAALLRFAGSPADAASPPGAAVTYTARSGATVFSSGTLLVIWALDDLLHRVVPENGGLQRFVYNMLDALSGAAGGGAA